MIFQKLKSKAPAQGGLPPAAEPAAGAARPTRLVVERVEHMAVIGWAAAGNGNPPVELRLDNRAAEAPVERGVRQDVANALGLPADQPYGFRIELPPGAWSLASDGEAAGAGFQVRAGEQLAPVSFDRPFAAMLADWLDKLRSMPLGAERERQLYRLMAHVAHSGGPARLADDHRQWLTEAARQRGAEAALSDAHWQAPAPLDVRGALEQSEGLALLGWAFVADAPSERIRLVCNGQEVACSVVRFERKDVQQALGVSRLQLGFEIELPSSMWSLADAQGACALEVLVEHQAITKQAVRLDRATLLQCLHQARLAELGAGPDEEATARGERQYRLLLVIEHIAAAGMQAGLAAADAEFLSAQAERFGLQTLLEGAASASAAVAASAAAPAHDYTTLMLWRLLRQFNEALAAGAQAATPALERILRESGVQGEIRHRLLVALLPYFSGQGKYAELRPWLDLARLRKLAAGTYAAELSMLLPELVSAGDLESAARVMERLNDKAPGWLNTECVGEAVRLLALHWRGEAGDKPDAAKLVKATLQLLKHQSQAYWSRLHDQHLVNATVALIAAGDSMPAPLASEVVWVALHSYALAPNFWQSLLARCPDTAEWRPELRDAHRLYERIHGRLTDGTPVQPADLLTLAPLLSRIRAFGNTDAAIVARELMLAAVPRLGQDDAGVALAAFAQLDEIGATEALRLAAHPLASAAVVAQAPDLAGRIRSVSGVPHHPKEPLVIAAHAQLERLSADAAAADAPAVPSLMQSMRSTLTLLMDADSGYIGVRIAALAWIVARRHLSAAASSAWLGSLRDAWMAAFDAAVSERQPPAALTGCWSALASSHHAEASADAAVLVAEMQRALTRRYGVRIERLLPQPGAALALQCRDPLRSTLVVIYSCRRNLDTRVRRIRDTWAHDLRERGIPYLVMVGDGQGEIEGDVLSLAVSDTYEDLPHKTLALVDWVYRHTDFDHLLKIDDDCHLAVDAFLSRSVHTAHHYLGRRLYRAEGNTDRLWHQDRSATRLGAQAIDKSPEPSLYADGGAGYCLSRLAMGSALDALQTTAGARLTRSAYMEDKLLGDLMTLCGIGLSNQGHETLLRRRFGPGAIPVNAWQNIFYPGPLSPTLISHLDDADALPAVQQGMASARLTPSRLWPTHLRPVLGGVEDSNQLELLSSVEGVRALSDAPLLVVAVARNERVLMPHFLAHYRGLGARHFVLIDNLSDDGTREYLLQQPDVVLYSADTEYRHSHYGVSWQQAVLGAHALGKWAVLADIDEFLVYPGCENLPLAEWLAQHARQGSDAVMTLMIDMYPEGDLAAADFERDAPFEVARHFDREPLIHWRLGSGSFSNSATYLSALRHRLIPDSAPNIYTCQKIAALRYQPWVRLSEGLHYASNLRVAEQPAYFAHFKYHAGFKKKVELEVARKQHFNGAEEYRKYLNLIAETNMPMNDATLSAAYAHSNDFENLLPATSKTKEAQ